MIIYICDRDEDTLKGYEEILKKLYPNVELKFYMNSHEVLSDFASRKPDVVFLEAEEGDAFFTSKTIIEKYKGQNIIFSSLNDKFALDAMMLFASGYIIKPITENVLFEELENLRYPIN